MTFGEQQHITIINMYKQDNKEENEWNELTKLTFNKGRFETSDHF